MHPNISIQPSLCLLASPILLNQLHHIHYQCLKLPLRYLTIPVGVQFIQNNVDIVIRWLLNIESIRQSFEQQGQFVSFDCTRLVRVKCFESVTEFLRCHLEGLLQRRTGVHKAYFIICKLVSLVSFTLKDRTSFLPLGQYLHDDNRQHLPQNILNIIVTTLNPHRK